jgi:hypothetical protein
MLLYPLNAKLQVALSSILAVLVFLKLIANIHSLSTRPTRPGIVQRLRISIDEL